MYYVALGNALEPEPDPDCVKYMKLNVFMLVLKVYFILLIDLLFI